MDKRCTKAALKTLKIYIGRKQSSKNLKMIKKQSICCQMGDQLLKKKRKYPRFVGYRNSIKSIESIRWTKDSQTRLKNNNIFKYNYVSDEYAIA